MRIKDFTTEYRRNPIGLDELPRFSWKLESEKKNTLQKACCLRVWQEEDELPVWDSGWTESEQSVLVPYAGDALRPFTTYRVLVEVEDNHGGKAQAEGMFETGLMEQKNWDAAWISHSFPEEEESCPVFVRKISLMPEKSIKRARAYVTALGIYDLRVNGVKAGDAYLAPGWTSYHNRLQYQTYDIGGLLSKGGNQRIEITVANGWYKGYLNCEGENGFYGDRVAVLAMIRLEYADGTVETIGTDEQWKVTTGPVVYSELYHGETQDFSKNAGGSREKTKAVTKAVLFDASDKVRDIVAQESEPVRITTELPAARKLVTPKGELVIDFGQNLPGFVRVKLPELSGEKLVIRHAETLDKEGNFYTENLRTARCTDTYIYGPDEVDRIVAPRFTYRGFRYICLEGVTVDVDMSRFTACVLHTDMAQTGTFCCDDPKVNRLQKNIEWGQRSNFVDIPTDCPQRDERLGWTGDAQIFCRTAMFQFQCALFYRKWMRDVAAETDDEHGVPHIVPNIVGPATGTAVWSDCATVIPWTAYMIYGDKKTLKEQYPNMCRWVEYIRRNCGDDILWMNGFQRGDWLALDSDESLHLMSGGTDKNLVANVYYAYSVRCVRDAAKVLGKRQDARKYGRLYDAIVEELNQEYVTGTGRLVSETQTACALFLYFDLIREEHRSRVVKILGDNLTQHRGHLTTGFVGTAYLCHALSENGRHELAENLLLNEEYPGWLYAVNMGATTIWERWNSILPNGDFDASGMNSLNHYTYGSIGDWLYRKVAGINLLEPGYKKILIRPMLTRGLTKVDASLETMYGTIESHVTCRDGKITVQVTIPANTTAILELPERDDEIELGSGTYFFSYVTTTNLSRRKITMDSTLGDVLDEEGGEDIYMEFTGSALSDSIKNYLRPKTLRQLAAMMPGGEEVLSKLVDRMNARQ